MVFTNTTHLVLEYISTLAFIVSLIFVLFMFAFICHLLLHRSVPFIVQRLGTARKSYESTNQFMFVASL